MLVNCASYREGKKVADLSIPQIHESISNEGTFVWVALKDPAQMELEELGRQFDLHPLALEDASSGNQRPKIEEYGASLFVVLQTIEPTPSGDLEVGEVDIFVGKSYALSTRNKTKQGFAHVRERCEREPELLKHGSVFVLYALMDAVVDRYFPIIEKLEVELELIEEQMFSRGSSARKNIEDLYLLKQRLMTLQHAVMPLLEAVGKLYGGRVPQICYGMQDYFRDVADHLIRILKSIESIREMTTTAIQVNLSLIALSESEVSKKLAAYGALFAVPTAIAGIYGMNFKAMPELEWSFGYPSVLCAIVFLDLLLWRRFRKAGWI